jgi:hypothetical protein
LNVKNRKIGARRRWRMWFGGHPRVLYAGMSITAIWLILALGADFIVPFDPDQKSSFFVYGDDENMSYYTRYKNPKITALVEQGRSELDPEKRRQIYADVPLIPVGEWGNAILAALGVQELHQHPGVSFRLFIEWRMRPVWKNGQFGIGQGNFHVHGTIGG